MLLPQQMSAMGQLGQMGQQEEEGIRPGIFPGAQNPPSGRAMQNSGNPAIQAAFDELRKAQQGVTAPQNPARPPQEQGMKFGTQDLLTGLLPLALMLISGKNGQQMAGGFLPGYLQGKQGKTDRDNRNAMTRFEAERGQQSEAQKLAMQRAQFAQTNVGNLMDQERNRQTNEDRDLAREDLKFRTNATLEESKRLHDATDMNRLRDDYQSSRSLSFRRALNERMGQLDPAMHRTEEQLKADFAPIQQANNKTAIDIWGKSVGDEIAKFGWIPEERAKEFEQMREDLIGEWGVDRPGLLPPPPTRESLQSQKQKQLQENWKQQFDRVGEENLKKWTEKAAQKEIALQRLNSIDRSKYQAEYDRAYAQYRKDLKDYNVETGGVESQLRTKWVASANALRDFNANNPQPPKGKIEPKAVTAKRIKLQDDMSKSHSQLVMARGLKATIPPPIAPTFNPPPENTPGPKTQEATSQAKGIDKERQLAAAAMEQFKNDPEKQRAIKERFKQRTGQDWK